MLSFVALCNCYQKNKIHLFDLLLALHNSDKIKCYFLNLVLSLCSDIEASKKESVKGFTMQKD